MKLIIFVFFGLCTVSFCYLGVDISELYSTSGYQCLVNNDYHFAIPRGYCSPGYVDPNVRQNILNARAGGMSYVDAYIFPCVPCANPEEQANSLVDWIAGYDYGMIWIDVEPWAWSGDKGVNQDFIRRMANQLKNRGQNIGIYTNNNGWSQIVGSWTEMASLPLWWAYWDNDPSYSVFYPFGGWSKFAIKQYVGDTEVCGLSVDLDFY